MSRTVPRRLAVLLALLCVLAACKPAQERYVSLSDIVKSGKSAQGQHIQVTAVVTYSDPAWRLLFVQDKNVGMFLTVPPELKIAAGDSVHIAGTISDAGALTHTSYQILSNKNALPVPVKVKDYATLPAYFSQLVEVTGTVRQSGTSNGRPHVQLATGHDELPVYFREAPSQGLPVPGSLITVAGVAAADFDATGKFRGPKLFSASAEQVHVLKPGPVDWFSMPLKKLADLKSSAAGTLVHVTGEIVNPESPSVTDGATSVPLHFADPASKVTGISDIAGFWTGSEIRDAAARPMSHLLAKNGDIVHLAQLKHLSFSDASARRPVTVRVIVTYVDKDWGVLFVQDETAGAYVDVHNVKIQLRPGDEIDISGVSGAGGYAPQIDQPHIGFVRRAHLPEPAEINLFDQNMAEYDSRWCRIRGVVHTAREVDGRTILDVGAGATDVSVQLPQPMPAEELLDREVSVTGVFAVLFNDRRQAIGHQIFSPAPSFMKVLDSRTGYPDPVSIVSLQRFNLDTDERHSVAVSGTVVLKTGENTIFVEDSTAGLQVRGAGPLKVADGEQVTVRGFVTSGAYSPVLEHAVVITSAPGKLPEPSLISVKSALDGHHDSEHVSIRAILTAVRSSPDGAILILNDAGTLFEAVGPANDLLNDLRPGSEVQVRGICRVEVDGQRHTVTGFNLAFDSPESLSVLRTGPWWDSRKITWVLVAVALISALAALWIVVLRQKVEVRTRELQSSVEGKRKAQRFEAARNQVLEAIARNAPPPESMEHLALAVQDQIEGAVCAIAMSPDGKSFLDGKPSAVLVAPSMPEDLQRSILPVFSSVLVADDGNDALPNDTDVMATVLEVAKSNGVNFSDADLVVAFSGAGELAGLVMIFFPEDSPADADHATRILQSASRLVSLARDHWHMHERLVFEARHDTLTGLPNRTVSEDRLEQAIARAQRRKQMFAVLCIDLDGFKAVNDNFGHHAGDELLRTVSSRLRSRIRHSDTLARIGGDEFLAIIEDCRGDSAAQAVAESLVASLHEPIHLDGKTVSISGSVGIAMFPTDGQQAAELRRNADQAMYRAKSSGGGKICFCSGQPLKKATAATPDVG